MNTRSFLPVLLLAIGLTGCNSKKDKSSENTDSLSAALPVVQLEEQNTLLPHLYVGDVKAEKNVEIYARVKGYLEQIYIDEGQDVRKGQILFRINNEEYNVALAKAKANLQSAIAEAKAGELELNRVTQLVEKNVISKTELEVAQARLAALKAKVAEAHTTESQAEIHLALTNIRAPFDGIIDRIPYKVGSLINEGTLLTTVSDIRNVYVYFKVSENEYLEFIKSRKESQQDFKSNVELMLADGSMFPVKGLVETMEGEFDEGTGSIAFRAKFNNPEKLLKHGSSGTVRLTNTLNQAVLVPQKSVMEIQDKNYVFVVDANNRVKMRNFVPRSRIANFYIVESGLKSGETIVYEGSQSLKDDMIINRRPVKPEGLTNSN